jgi:hypothetical protein
MSETNTDPVIPDPGGAPQPAVPDPSPPESTPDTPDTSAEQTEEEGERRESRGDRRFAELTARLSAAERRDAERERELEFYRRQLSQQAPRDDTPEQAAQRLRMEVRAEVEAEIKQRNFHEQGQAEYADWGQRTDRLIKMGADPAFAQLLLDMPVGEAVKVTGALAEDPDAVERIARLQTAQGRALALGKYAATIEEATHDRSRPNGVNGAAAVPVVTRAPAPVRPVTGRASPQFNEYTATAQQLADFYMRQTLEKQTRR